MKIELLVEIAMLSRSNKSFQSLKTMMKSKMVLTNLNMTQRRFLFTTIKMEPTESNILLRTRKKSRFMSTSTSRKSQFLLEVLLIKLHSTVLLSQLIIL